MVSAHEPRVVAPSHAVVDSTEPRNGIFSSPPTGRVPPFLRLAGDLAGSGQLLSRAPAPSRPALQWAGDFAFSSGLDLDATSDDADFTIDDPDTRGAPAGDGSKLADGMVVYVEVRDGSGAVLPLSHEYPIDGDGNLRIPGLSKITARDSSMGDLRQALGQALRSISPSATVNLSLSSTTVSYADPLARSDRLFLRILDDHGNIDASSGAYTIDSEGKLHLPRLGDVDTSETNLGQLEGNLEKAMNQFRRGAVVNVSRTALS
jgi:protein involved in polysaccharide export with SLBB domain